MGFVETPDGQENNMNGMEFENQTTSKIKFVKDRPGHDIRYALNSDKIKKHLGWYPKTSFKEGIRLTFEWYNNNKSYYKSLSKKDIVSRLGKK